MNNLVEIALKRPYTFVVLAILVVLYGTVCIFKTPTDVFPEVKIPAIAVVWEYDGLLPADVSGRIAYQYERLLTTTVEGIERLESDSYYGFCITKIFLQPGGNLAATEAEVAAISQTATKLMPPDISSPLIMRLEASSIPVAMLQLSSDSITPSELYNQARQIVRPALVTVEGVILPHPYGGLNKQLLVSVDPQKLLSKKLTLSEVHKALNKQNIVLPAGDQKIKGTDWMVQTNASPLKLEEFADMPIKRVGNATVYLRDIASIDLAGPPQTNSVIIEGKQSVAIVVMKSGDASTLDVVEGIRQQIPRIQKMLPAGVHLKLLNDASGFVRDSIADVVREMLTATALAGLAVLLFLGSWRATVIIALSIPLSILASIVCLHWLGESINMMTLGGLALAVGILVDNATVMIENIDVHIAMKKPIDQAIIDAANQILVPTLVGTLCIIIVWLPLFGLSGVSGYLFAPMAEAIMFAVLASFALSRTLVPTMAKYMLSAHTEHNPHPHNPSHSKNIFVRFQRGFELRFEAFKDGYRRILEQAVQNRRAFIVGFLVLAFGSGSLLAFNGREFFPEVKSGTLQMHMRLPLGTRMEVTNRITALVSKDIESLLPNKVETIVNNCGLPLGPHNLAFIPTPTIGMQDCDLTINLKDDLSPVWDYRKVLRKNLRERYPGAEFTFQPADLTAKILNFGAPSPINVRIRGLDMDEDYAFARQLSSRLKQISGASDVVVQQAMRMPTLLVSSDRTMGLSVDSDMSEMFENMLIATSGSQQIDQQYWLQTNTGLSYKINVYVPQPRLTRLQDLQTIPVKYEEGSAQFLGSVSSLGVKGTPGMVTHSSIAPVHDIYVSAEERDLGSVLEDVEKITDEMQDQLPKAASTIVAGQAETMRRAYSELLAGLVAAVVLVYLLVVVNFQSWTDPFIIISSLPGALAGIAWALFVSHTNISVPALTGAIMCVGSSTANSILVVTYAKERMLEHGEALRAAVEAGYARMRPVLMTALAMIIGMWPMSVGNSPNAPLGRAVMGGLLIATFASLFFVPCVFALVYHKRSATLAARGVG